MTPSPLLAIGKIASETRIGGKRRFDPNTGGKESFIRRAHEVGFSLDEMRTSSTTKPRMARSHQPQDR